MSTSRKQEERLLTEDEWRLVRQTHHPAVQGLADSELLDLIKIVRERRNRAKTEAHRQRREMRGKSASKGAAAARKDDGTRGKLEILATSMRRLNGEHSRRRKMSGKTSLVESMRSALALKQASATERDGSHNSRHAYEGMRSIENSKRRKLVRPMELGRQRKAGAVAQAKKDSRG
jgi:hypothetical protein